MKSSHWNYGLYSMHHKHISYLNKPLSRLLPIRIMGYWSEPSQRSARCAALDENVQCTFCASSFGTHSAAHPLWLAWGLRLETTSLSIQQTFFSFYPYHFYHTSCVFTTIITALLIAMKLSYQNTCCQYSYLKSNILILILILVTPDHSCSSQGYDATEHRILLSPNLSWW